MNVGTDNLKRLNEILVELERPDISNYTIDGYLAGEFTTRYMAPDTDEIILDQNIVVTHDGKVYLLIFGSYDSEISKPGMKEIREHIIKSIKWETK